MANRKNTFLLKRSNVAGKIPTSGDLLLGELGINTADAILYTSGTTANSILPIGWDRIHRTGDTMTGDLIITGDLNVSGNTTILNLSGTSIYSNYIDFNTSSSVTPVAGRLFFDNQTNSLSYNPITTNNDVTLQIGQETWIRVFNNTGIQINNGDVVNITGTTSGTPNVTLAIASGNDNTLFHVDGVATHNIPDGDYGFITNFGLVRDINLTAFTIGETIYLSQINSGGLSSLGALSVTGRTCEIGHVLDNSSGGTLQVSLYNETKLSNNTLGELNILNVNNSATGLFEFDGLSIASSTEFNVGALKGWFVDALNPLNPIANFVDYAGATGLTTPYLSSTTETFIMLNSAHTITTQTTFPTPQERREKIYLGKLGHADKATIINAFNEPDYVVSPLAQTRDMFTPIRLINDGVLPSPNGSNLNFNTSSGTLYGFGIGVMDNVLNPNSISISANTPTTFQYRVQTGGTSTNTIVIDPTNYDVSGVITTVGGGANTSTNQRIYLLQNGQIRIQYGQTIYGSLSEAIAGSQTETFVTFSNFKSVGILIGIISITRTATDLSNTSQARILNVSKFGESVGSAAGLSTTTLQQAYNNSITPEIVTNSTLGAFTLRNGAGTSDNTTRLYEGMNSGGTVTSFIMADGTISGGSIYGDTFYGNGSGLTFNTISASTFYGGNSILNSLSATTISGGTFYGDGSNLTGVQSPITNQILVSSGTSGDYQSIKAAVDSITDNSTTNRYSILVGPGTFIEDTITTKSYVTINGAGESTIVQTDATNKDVFVLTPNTVVSDLAVDGATFSGKSAFTVLSSMGPGVSATIRNIHIRSCDNIFTSNLGAGQFGLVVCSNVYMKAGSNITNGFDIQGSGFTTVSLNDSKCSITTPTTDFINLRGSNNRVIIVNCGVLVQSALGGSLTNFIRLYNGATIDVEASGIDGANTAILNDNNGTGTNIRISSLNILNSITNDINIEHPSTIGFFNGRAELSKITIEATNTTFHSVFTEPTGGFVIEGDISYGTDGNNVTNYSNLFRYGYPIGLYGGGLITGSTGLDINVSAGDGYLFVNDSPTFINFTGGTLSISSGSTRYVFVDTSGVLNSQTSIPDISNKLLLGKVITDGTSVVSITNARPVFKNISEINEVFHRDIHQTMFSDGVVTSENVTPLKIDVTGGNYFYSTQKTSPTGGNAITFTPVYKNGSGGHVYSAATDLITNTKYDDSSGTLANITSGKYVKHTLFISDDEVAQKFFLVLGQTQFDDVTLATDGSSPTPPNGFSGLITPISDIIVTPDSGSVVTFIDRRTFLGSSSMGSIGGGTSDHGELTGLADDDHTQYLLVGGTRAMTGSLNMGSNTITNAGTINSVSVTAHASRHLPNGADPLSTGIPSSIGTSNQTGTANALSRQDHIHSHGNQAGGTLHSVATTSTAGFMSASDKGFLTSGGTINGTIIADAFIGDGSGLTGITASSSRIESNVATTNATPTEVEKIDNLTDNTTNIVEVFIKAYQSGGSQWGVWKRTLIVTKTSGTVTIQEINADVDKTSSGLNASSVTFTVNSGDIDIDVIGIAATTINWESAYSIIL